MSIYRDPQGACWVFEFSRRVNGQRIRTRRRLPSAWTRAQADAFDRRESARLFGLATGERERFTVDQAVARYLTERVPALKHGIEVAQELDLLSSYFTGQPLDQLPDVCAAYLADHRARLAPATLRKRLRYLTAAARWGWKHHNMADADPAARVVMPAVKNERQVYIDRAQMLRLARACGQWETRALIRVAFYSGMRFSEICAAEVVDGRFVLRDTKNGDPRIVPVHPKIRRVVSYGWAWPCKQTMHYWFTRAREAVAMPDLHFHDLRHSSASAMLNAGVPLFTVGAVLGHKSSASTKRYAHHATATLEDAVGRIGRKAG